MRQHQPEQEIINAIKNNPAWLPLSRLLFILKRTRSESAPFHQRLARSAIVILDGMILRLCL